MMPAGRLELLGHWLRILGVALVVLVFLSVLPFAWIRVAPSEGVWPFLLDHLLPSVDVGKALLIVAAALLVPAVLVGTHWWDRWYATRALADRLGLPRDDPLMTRAGAELTYLGMESVATVGRLRALLRRAWAARQRPGG